MFLTMEFLNENKSKSGGNYLNYSTLLKYILSYIKLSKFKLLTIICGYAKVNGK